MNARNSVSYLHTCTSICFHVMLGVGLLLGITACDAVVRDTAPQQVQVDAPTFDPHVTADSEDSSTCTVRVGLTKTWSGAPSTVDLVWTPPPEISRSYIQFQGIQPEAYGDGFIFHNVPVRDAGDVRDDIVITYAVPYYIEKLVDTFVSKSVRGQQGFTLTHKWPPSDSMEPVGPSSGQHAATASGASAWPVAISMYSAVSPTLARADAQELFDFLQSGKVFLALHFPVAQHSGQDLYRLPVVMSGDLAPKIFLLDYSKRPPTIASLPFSFAPEYQAAVENGIPGDSSWHWVTLAPDTSPAIEVQGDFPLAAGLWELAFSGGISLPDFPSGCAGCTLETMVCWVGEEAPPVFQAAAQDLGPMNEYQNGDITCAGPLPLTLAPGDSSSPPIQLMGTFVDNVTPPERSQIHVAANFGGPSSSIAASVHLSSSWGRAWTIYEGDWNGPNLSHPMAPNVTIKKNETYNFWLVRDVPAGDRGIETLTLRVEPANTALPASWTTTSVVIGDWVAPSENLHEAWIPVGTHASGAQGSRWRTDLGLLNNSGSSTEAEIEVEMEGTPITKTVTVGGKRQLILQDFFSLFPATGSAAFRVRSATPLTLSSRTYSQMGSGASCFADGTLGQFLGASDRETVLAAGQSAFLPQLTENEAYRTNIALTNTGSSPASVKVRLYDDQGISLASYTVDLAAGEWAQENRAFFHHAGASHLAAGYARIDVESGSGIVGYASVVDNRTNDPTTIPLIRTDGGVKSSWIAVAVHAGGANGSRWRTNLGLLNTESHPAQVTITVHTADGEHPTAVSLGAGQQVILEDLLDGLGVEGAGSLEITSDRKVIAGSRTYSQIADGARCFSGGTLGQFLPSSADSVILSAGDVAWLPQLIENESYRSNIALTNTGKKEAHVTVRLYDGTGEELASYAVSLSPGQWAQENQPFVHHGGAGDLSAVYATVEVTSGDGVIGYGSVVDNTTNDPTTVPLMR